MTKITNRLEKVYREEIAQKLAKEFSIANRMAIPRPIKVVVNVGSGEMAKSKEYLESLGSDLAKITGQKPSIRRAKVSVASFSVCQGMPVGYKVTLRGSRMYVFLDKFFSIVLPRLRDFRGLPAKSVDGRGNYTLGLTDHTVFPEIDLSKTLKPFGMEITIVTSSDNKNQSLRLLELLGLPFEKN